VSEAPTNGGTRNRSGDGVKSLFTAIVNRLFMTVKVAADTFVFRN